MNENPGIEELVAFRKYLHSNPELSGHERLTSQIVHGLLEKCNPDALFSIAGTGIAAVFDGQTEGPAVLLRSELDALPIQETNLFPHRSQHPGIAHKCGHDGHTAILIGVANELAARRPARGRVALLFQPAEETGHGAKAVLTDPRFGEIRPDFAFALHNIPGIAKNVVVLKSGAFTAAVCTLVIKLQGKSAHAAEPENGLNPIYAITEIVRKAMELEQPDPAAEDFTLVTPVFSKVGEIGHGTAPGVGEIHLTIRCWDTQLLEQVCKRLADWAMIFALGQGFKLEIAQEEEFAANTNDPECVDWIREVAHSQSIITGEVSLPFRWGEDFGLFTETYRGAMFGIGAGVDSPALHNPDYDFPDELISTGVNVFCGLVNKILG